MKKLDNLRMEPKDGKSPPANNRKKFSNAVGVDITVYTDPLCCWTRSMRPQWLKLVNEKKSEGPLTIRYKMGGLLPSWHHFNDSVHSIQKPIQMGPEWLHAKTVSGVPIDDKIWINDPPASSFPACIAVKCVEFQSNEAAIEYFYLLQESQMGESQNISKTQALLRCANILAEKYAGFDLEKFKSDLFGVTGQTAFARDLQECKYLNINRLPTIVFKSATGRSMLLKGYQTDEMLQDAWLKMDLHS